MRAKNSLLRAVLVLGVALGIYFGARMEQGATAALPAKAPTLASNAAEPQQQYPVVDAIANKIIQKYQNSTCEQLWQEKAAAKNKPKSPEEQRAIGILHNDPQLREVFIGKIAAPVANKMFECGMIP
jgi:hypothetical protein